MPSSLLLSAALMVAVTVTAVSAQASPGECLSDMRRNLQLSAVREGATLTTLTDVGAQADCLQRCCQMADSDTEPGCNAVTFIKTSRGLECRLALCQPWSRCLWEDGFQSISFRVFPPGTNATFFEDGEDEVETTVAPTPAPTPAPAPQNNPVEVVIDTSNPGDGDDSTKGQEELTEANNPEVSTQGQGGGLAEDEVVLGGVMDKDLLTAIENAESNKAGGGEEKVPVVIVEEAKGKENGHLHKDFDSPYLGSFQDAQFDSTAMIIGVTATVLFVVVAIVCVGVRYVNERKSRYRPLREEAYNHCSPDQPLTAGYEPYD